jgi:hypothetical protein
MAPGPSPSGWGIIGKEGRWEKIHVEAHSDGEQRHWPPKPYRPGSDERYLINLAKAWAEHLGILEQGEISCVFTLVHDKG